MTLARAFRLAVAIVCFLPLTTVACAINPATGETQLALISEEQEIAMGREAAQQVEGSVGIIDDPSIQEFVDGVGQRLAAESERPNLPWSFKVVDDPSINAFALPGGFIYVTRGIMTVFMSEAELAAVLGHEIGHVTGRHSVSRISQQQLLGGLAVAGASILDLGPLGRGAVGTGLNLLFLDYSRDDERQADDLGLRYMTRGSYAPRQMLNVFETLQRAGDASGGGGTPSWLATHPTPDDRFERISRRIETDSIQLADPIIRRDEYLRRIDGMVYGENPRNGFFQGSAFLHPDLRFRLEFPSNWRTQNLARAVLAGSPDEDALIQLTLSSHESAEAAYQDFALQEGVSVRTGSGSRASINGSTARVAHFEADTAEGAVGGVAGFIEYLGDVYEIIGYSVVSRLGDYEGTFESTIRSFDRLRDEWALIVEPRRISLVRIDAPMSLQDFADRHGGSVDIGTLSLINGVPTDANLPAGTWKSVVGKVPATQ